MGEDITTMREALRAAHDGLRDLAERHENGEAMRSLASAQARLSVGELRLVVLGEYKRGKSTLVNALLGTPVLPMDVIPLTSVITEVAYGADRGARVEFLDGRAEEVPAGTLPKYVTEPENPRNARGVKRAIVRVPAPLLRSGVTIVDTPGVGSIFEHNTDVTYEYLAESDAVVIVLAADQPLSAEERRLLAALAGITDHVLFAVNRTDTLTEDDAARSVAFIRRTLVELDGAPPEHVFPISARNALAAAAAGGVAPAPFAAFERALTGLLIGRKTEILERRAARLVERAADFVALQLESEQHAMGRARDELEETIRRIETAATKAGGDLERSSVLLGHDVRRVHEVTLSQALDATKQRLTSELWPRVEEALRRERQAPLPRLTGELAVSIGEWVVTELRKWHPTTQDLVREGLRAALEGHMQRVTSAVGDVVSLANERLGMRAQVPRAEAPLDERARFYYKDWDYAGGALRAPWWTTRLPRRWAMPRAVRALRELLDRRIQQNLEAIRYDWVTRLGDAERRFARSSREQLDGIVRLLTEGLRRAERQQAAGEDERRRRDLERDLETVRGLEARLARAGRAVPVPDGMESA